MGVVGVCWGEVVCLLRVLLRLLGVLWCFRWSLWCLMWVLRCLLGVLYPLLRRSVAFAAVSVVSVGVSVACSLYSPKCSEQPRLIHLVLFGFRPNTRHSKATPLSISEQTQSLVSVLRFHAVCFVDCGVCTGFLWRLLGFSVVSICVSVVAAWDSVVSA